MKTPEMQRLETDMSNSAELRERFQAALERIIAEGKAASDGEVMAQAAAEFGYQITVADLERALAEQEQFSPEELAMVSGGIGDKQDSDGHDAWCLTIWNCFTVTLHNLSAKEPENLKVHAFYNSACWSNYRCIAFHYGL